jgi:UDP-glucose 4-epimerase
MRIIVTGGAGFIGTNLVKRLMVEGHDVVSLDNYSTGKRANEQDGCEYIIGDINDNSLSLESYDVIFHIAALARIQPSLKDPSTCIEANVNGTLNILNLARVHNIPVIYAGSSSVHHGLYGSPYAWSKHAGEQLCELFSTAFGLNTTICRFYNVYGPHQLEEGDYSTVLGIYERQYRNNQPLTITADGEQRRDFTHVNDIVDGLYKCIGRKSKAEIFELGSGKNYSINEVAELFKTETKYIPARKGEYPFTLCDYSHAHKELGWKPKENLEIYIKQLLESYEK